MSRKILIALCACAALSAPDAAMAHYYNATFDCGHGRTVWIGNPVTGAFGTKERGRKVIFEITISDFDLSKVISPIVRWNSDKDEVTLDGRRCRQMTDEEVENQQKLERDE
jgi:hypothetical protein